MRKRCFILAALIGCGSSSPGGTAGPERLPGFDPPPPPANGFQVLLPPVKGLAPGSDIELCTWSRVMDDTTDVKTVQAFQTGVGHHVVLYATSSREPEGTLRECQGPDTINFRFVAGSGGEGQGIANTAPGDLVYRIPAGSQIVINHHYLNATQSAQDAQSGVNVTLADPSAKHTPSGSLAFLDTSLSLPPGAATLDIVCTMQRDLDLWLFLPHMHQWGRHITIDWTSAAGTSRLVDQEWNPELVFHPPEHRTDPSMPFAFKTGDRLAVHCEWLNDTGSPMSFGKEMCVAFGAFVDDQGIGNLACNRGEWGTF